MRTGSQQPQHLIFQMPTTTTKFFTTKKASENKSPTAHATHTSYGAPRTPIVLYFRIFFFCFVVDEFSFFIIYNSSTTTTQFFFIPSIHVFYSHLILPSLTHVMPPDLPSIVTLTVPSVYLIIYCIIIPSLLLRFF